MSKRRRKIGRAAPPPTFMVDGHRITYGREPHEPGCPRRVENLQRLSESERWLYGCTCEWDRARRAA